MEHLQAKDRRDRSSDSSDEASVDLGAESHSESGDSNESELSPRSAACTLYRSPFFSVRKEKFSSNCIKFISGIDSSGEHQRRRHWICLQRTSLASDAFSATREAIRQILGFRFTHLREKEVQATKLVKRRNTCAYYVNNMHLRNGIQTRTTVVPLQNFKRLTKAYQEYSLEDIDTVLSEQGRIHIRSNNFSSSTSIISSKVPRQPDDVQCGFYVMAYMKHIIEDAFGDPGSIQSIFAKANYSREDIDQVHTEWTDIVSDLMEG